MEGKLVNLQRQIDKLADEERKELLNRYCPHCGCIQANKVAGYCQCWNDE